MTVTEVAALLEKWDHILILSHASPDGDTLGSAAALMRALKQKGKTVAFKCADPIEEKYEFAFASLDIDLEFTPDKIITVDVANKELLGELAKTYGDRVDLCIDHHAFHEPFAKCEWVEPQNAANVQLIYFLLREMGVQMNQEIADCIYLGLTTDTGCFKYANVTALTHRIAADLIDLGAKAAKINQIMFDTKEIPQIEIMKLALDKIEIFSENRCALIPITTEMMRTTGVTEHQLGEITALPRKIAGVKVGIVLKEKENGHVKVSVRTNGFANAAEICRHFGGGGHRGAGGCLISKPISDAITDIKLVCADYLDKLDPPKGVLEA